MAVSPSLPKLRGKRPAKAAPLPAQPTAHDTASRDPTSAGPPSDELDPRPGMFKNLPEEIQQLYANMSLVPVVREGYRFSASYQGCLERNCYRFGYEGSASGNLFVCLHCGHNQTGSASRLIQHWTGAFGASVEGLPSYARVPRIITAACPKFRLSVEEIKRLAAEGQSDCKLVCSANEWELTDKHGRPLKHRYSPDWTREENMDAQRDHVLGIIFTASSFRSSEHMYFRRMLDKISKSKYKAPGKERVRKIVTNLSSEIDALKPQAYKTGPGTCVFDHATGSNGEAMAGFFFENPAGRILVKLLDSGYDEKNAETIRNQMKEVIQEIGPSYVSAVGSDSAKSAYTAYQMLRQDPEFKHIKWGPCGTHAGNRVVDDIKKVWVGGGLVGFRWINFGGPSIAHD